MESSMVYAMPGIVESPPIFERCLNMAEITKAELRLRSRERPLVEKRQLAMYLLRKKTGLTFEQIGQLFGRDHATVIHSLKVIRDRMFWDKQFEFDVIMKMQRL